MPAPELRHARRVRGTVDEERQERDRHARGERLQRPTLSRRGRPSPPRAA